MNALPDSADGAPSPEALPPQLNPTANLRALTPAEAVERLSHLPAPPPAPAQGTPPVAAPAPVAARPSRTRYAAAALALSLVVLAVVLLTRR